MKGFQKINLDKTSSIEKEEVKDGNKKDSMKIKTQRKFKISKKVGIIFGIIIIFVVFSLFAVVLPAKKVYSSAKVTYTQVKLFVDAMKKQNVKVASDQLEKTKQALAQTQKDLSSMSYLRFIPLANLYYGDADHLMKAASSGLKTAGIVIDSLTPYADVLGLQGQGSFVMGSAENRIKTAVMTMGKITPNIDTISDSLKNVRQEIDAIDPNHYPPFIFGNKVQNQLKNVKTFTDQGVTFAEEARPLIKVLPSLLGESTPKKYLVLFQNDKELRPTGGFITAYSIFDVDKGVINVERSEDIYNLDASIPNKTKAPDPILNYLPDSSVLNLRDSNLSPDFITSMDTFQSLYNKSPDKVDVDGIIGIDTYMLVSTIKILNDQVTADGITFTTKNDPRCDCPQVIYELENNISRPVNYVRKERKSLLGSLLYAILQKSLSSSPKIYWGPLFQAFLAQTNQKHVLFDLFAKDAQSGIEALNAAGRITSFDGDGDYLHINDSNFGGQKSNLFTKEEVESNYDVKNDGSIVKTVTISYTNNHPPSDCSLERGGLCLNAELRDWLRIYVPKGSELVDSKGSTVKVTTYDELGKTVIDGFVKVRPLGKATYTISYRLPFKLAANSPLPVLIQKQPGTDGNNYVIKNNNRTLQTFQLFADKELKLKF